MGDWPFSAGETVSGLLGIAVLLCGGAYWVGCVNTDRSTFKTTLNEFMEEIRADIKDIFSRLPPPQTAEGASPAQLTEFGRKVADGVNARAWAEQAAQSVLADDDLLSLEPFQIEAFCDSYVEEQSRQEGIVQDKVQQAIYEFGIDRDRALPVLRIPLREALLHRKKSLQR